MTDNTKTRSLLAGLGQFALEEDGSAKNCSVPSWLKKLTVLIDMVDVHLSNKPTGVSQQVLKL